MSTDLYACSQANPCDRLNHNHTGYGDSPTLTRIAADVDQTIALFELLRTTKTEIADLRRRRCHLTAGIMRDELLCQLEQWLDPAGIDHRQEVQAAQRADAGALALHIDPELGF